MEYDDEMSKKIWGPGIGGKTEKTDLKDKVKRAEQKILFEEYKKIAFGIQTLGGIIQNSMTHTKEDMDKWLVDVEREKAKFQQLVKATVESVGFKLVE